MHASMKMKKMNLIIVATNLQVREGVIIKEFVLMIKVIKKKKFQVIILKSIDLGQLT